MRRGSPRVFIGLIAFVLLAAVVPLTLLADTVDVVPDDHGLLSSHPGAEFLPLLISNCAPPNELPVPCSGDHFYPKVDGDLASYISLMPTSGIYFRAGYYNFFSGETNFIPQPPNVDWWDDYLPQVSGNRIAFWRMEGTAASLSEAILVYDTTAHTTTEIKRLGPGPGYSGQLWYPAIGADTVAFADMSITYPGEVWVANLANPGAGLIQLSHNDDETDKRFDEWPSVSPDGRVVVWQSCVPFSPGNCDIWKATLSAGTWTSTAVTTDDFVEDYPKTDGTLIAYTKRPAGGDFGVFNQQDICWQPVAGGTEKCLAFEGYQTWPSVRGGLIAFSGAPRSESDTELELYVYHVDTNRLFQFTSTEGAGDALADLTVLQDGHFRVVFNTGPPSFPDYDRDVYGVTFTLPDIAAPVVTCEPEAADGQWHADNVSFSCTAEDAGSGLASEEDTSFALTTSVEAGDEWANVMTNSHEVCDKALPQANCTTAGPIGGNKIDRRAPSVMVTTPAVAATYTVGQVVTADYECLDAGSGVVSCVGLVADGAVIDTSTMGPKTFSVKGVDAVGHGTELNVSYTVTAPTTFIFGGFLPPVDPLPTLNSMKAGAAVPVRFSLGGNRGLAIFAHGFPKSQTVPCDSTTPEDGIEQTVTAGASNLSYDAATDTYSYVWKTDKGWVGTCRQLVMKFTDGSVANANFKFK